MNDQTFTKIEESQGPLEETLTEKPMTETISPSLPLEVPSLSPKRHIESDKLEFYFARGETKINELLEREVLDVQLPLVDREKNSIEIPSSLEGQERSIYLVITALCRISGIELYLYDSKINANTKNGSDSYCDGLLIGTFSDKPTKLDRSKKDLELGRATAYALKLRGELIKLKKLELIVKNNFYFGNNPNEKVGNTSVNFGLKLKFIDIWEDPIFGEAMYSVLLYLFEKTGLSQFSDIDFETSLIKYTIKFDEVVTKFYQPIRTTKRGKTQITGYRKGKKPNPSPLLTKGEYNLIMKIAGPLWIDLDHFKKEWSKSILAPSKTESLLSALGRLYKSRFEFLQKFGSLTTKRLQEVRASEQSANLKKVDVTLTMLHSTLKKRASPGTQFTREIRKLFDTNDWAIKECEINNNIQEGQFANFIGKEITASYVEDAIFIVKEDKIDIIPIEKETLQCLKALKNNLGRIREFATRISRCGSIYDVKQLELRWAPAYTVMTHIRDGIDQFVNKYQPEIITFLLERFFQIKSSAEEFTAFLIEIDKQIRLLEKACATEWRTDRNVLIDFSAVITKTRAKLVFGESFYIQPK